MNEILKQEKGNEALFKLILALQDHYSSETGLFVRFLREHDLGLTHRGLEAYAEHLLENHNGRRYRASTISWKLAAMKSRIRYIFEHSGINNNR